MKTLDFPLETASVSGDGQVEGIAATWGVNSYSERLLQGAFAASLGRHAKRKSMPAMLYAHDGREPIGRWLKLEERTEGLWVAGRISTATAKSREIRQLVEEKILTGLSIGFSALPGATKMEDGVRVLGAVELHEISFVSTPAQLDARVEARAFESVREFETALRVELGLSRAAARAAASGGWRGLAGDSAAVNPQEIEALGERIKSATSLISKTVGG